MDLTTAIAELRRRNEPVPKPGRLPTQAEVVAAEEKLGLRFSADYQRFLLEASDVMYSTYEPCIVTPTMPYADLVLNANEAWKMGVPRGWLPFCPDNGDYFCLDGDAVRYWAHDGNTDEHWTDLATWIEKVWLAGE